MYALNIDKETNRILSATSDRFGAPGQPRVESLPEGNLPDYLYVNGEYVHQPLPKPPELEPEPTQFDRVEAQVTYTAMMTDTLLEV